MVFMEKMSLFFSKFCRCKGHIWWQLESQNEHSEATRENVDLEIFHTELEAGAIRIENFLKAMSVQKKTNLSLCLAKCLA